MVVDGLKPKRQNDMTEVTTDADRRNPQCFEERRGSVEESWVILQCDDRI